MHYFEGKNKKNAPINAFFTPDWLLVAVTFSNFAAEISNGRPLSLIFDCNMNHILAFALGLLLDLMAAILASSLLFSLFA